MGLALAVAQVYIPDFIRRRKLQELFTVTAKSFRHPAPDLADLTTQECLTQYATFTRDRAEETIQQGRELEIKGRLFRNAYKLGRELRKEFHIEGTSEVMKMGRVVYRILGIDFKGNSQGEIEVRRCFFSTYYSVRICGLVSALDAGLLAGLSNGGELEFHRRITEGNSCCRASLFIIPHPFIVAAQSAGPFHTPSLRDSMIPEVIAHATGQCHSEG